MFWLSSSVLDWDTLLFAPEIQPALRFFLPDSQNTYKGRQKQVATIHSLYEKIDRITMLLGPGPRCQHQLERLRRICFLALTMQVLKYNVRDQVSAAPKELQAYNYGICNSWLVQYYQIEPCIVRRSQTGIVWKRPPTWADLLQQLFNWDDQDQYKVPFPRTAWDRLEYRLITKHAFQRIEERLGTILARKWRRELGLYATRFFSMIPKCGPERFANRTKRVKVINGEKKIQSPLGWFSAVHADVRHLAEREELPFQWQWKNQKRWDWASGEFMKHRPPLLFTDLEDFDFENSMS
jgi:hypothetical protein